MKKSLPVLVVCLAVVSLSIVAYCAQSELAISALYALTIGLVGAATIHAKYASGARRLFWFGFAVFGWIAIAFIEVWPLHHGDLKFISWDLFYWLVTSAGITERPLVKIVNETFKCLFLVLGSTIIGCLVRLAWNPQPSHRQPLENTSIPHFVARPHFSLLGLLLIIALGCLAFATLKTGSHFYLDSLYTITVGLLAFSVVGASFGARAARVFWFGFATLGAVAVAAITVSDTFITDGLYEWLLRTFTTANAVPTPAGIRYEWERKPIILWVSWYLAIMAFGYVGGYVARFAVHREELTTYSNIIIDERARSLRCRFRWLIGVIIAAMYIIVAVTALRLQSRFCVDLLFTLDVGLLAFALTGSKLAPAKDRAFWFGVAAFMMAGVGPEIVTWSHDFGGSLMLQPMTALFTAVIPDSIRSTTFSSYHPIKYVGIPAFGLMGGFLAQWLCKLRLNDDVRASVRESGK